MKFSIKGLFNKCDQIHSKLQIWSHLVKTSLMESFIFCVVYVFWMNDDLFTFQKIFNKAPVATI